MKTLSFKGTGSEYFNIWIVNLLLTIITLGIYYPWAKVRRNRYFYGNSVLDGRNFEYHATGLQLFKGFLISMALFITYLIVRNISPATSMFFVFIFSIAIPWIIWQGMKFNLYMTSFSNVRFSFVGALKESYTNFFLYPLGFGLANMIVIVLFVTIDLLLIKIILGIVFFTLLVYTSAFLKKINTEYLLNNTKYGQGKFIAKLVVTDLININFRAIGLYILLLLPVIFSIPVIETAFYEQNFIIFIVTYIWVILSLILVVTYKFVRERAYIFDKTKLDEKITFVSKLEVQEMMLVSVTNFLVVIFTLGLATPWAKVRMARLILENTKVSTEDIDNYVSKQQQESSLGDQIGDMFDVDVGIV
jgi:uncharacterized membrane protein YjgN (DUF898 family)